MIKWTDIDNEVEEFQAGYRQGFVSIFKKYEDVETDQTGGNGKVLTVNVTSFANRYGIAERTFRRWVDQEKDGGVTKSSRPGPNARALAEAAAQATAAAEAKAATTLAAALERQKLAAEKAQRQASLDAKNAQSRALKEQQEIIRKEEQAKAKAAADKEVAALKAEMTKAAKAAAFDLSTLSDTDKAKIMTLLANDPDSAGEWFAAQTIERDRKNKEATEKNRIAAEQRVENKARQAEQEAAKRRSREYADSALYHLTNKLMPLAVEYRNLSQYKPISFKDVISGDFESLDPIYNMAYALESAAASIREQLDMINAEQQIEAKQ